MAQKNGGGQAMTLKERLQDLPPLIPPGMMREKVIGILCLTLIALASMVKMDSPENVIINVVIAIAGFLAGGGGVRKPPNGG